jgi:uncharacterized damage-inducible protein DinB
VTEIAEHFIAKARSYISSSYLPKIERCLETLTDEDVWWRANEESNSIGNLLLHLEGSTRMWIISGVGASPNLRQRQLEFDERKVIPRRELLSRLRATVAEVDAILAGVEHEVLLEWRQVGDVKLTVLAAIFHAVEHFSMHTGQVITLTKLRTGKDLSLTN